MTNRTALLIIRARFEAHPSSWLRADVRWTTDVAGGLARPVHLADPEAVTDFVRDWLHDLEAEGRHDGP
jgi:hypothetical protein